MDKFISEAIDFLDNQLKEYNRTNDKYISSYYRGAKAMLLEYMKYMYGSGITIRIVNGKHTVESSGGWVDKTLKVGDTVYTTRDYEREDGILLKGTKVTITEIGDRGYAFTDNNAHNFCEVGWEI